MTKEQFAELLSSAAHDTNVVSMTEIMEDERGVFAVELDDGTQFFVRVIDP